MTNPVNDSSVSGVNSPAKTIPWWNRPVTGEGGLLGELLTKIEKEDVPETALALRNLQLMDLHVFAKTAEAIDSPKFTNEEFLTFARLKYMLSKGIGDYAELDESVRLLQLAIQAKDSFIAIDQTELRYRGYKQQEFYRFVDDLLKSKNQEDLASFGNKVHTKAEEILIQVKTEEGQNAIKAYARHMEKIAKHPLGLKLLLLFKTFNLADYSVLRAVADVILGIEVKHIYDLKKLVDVVNDNYDAFEKLKHIIQLPENRKDVEVYSLMIQVISLAHQYEVSYLKFEQLMKVIQKWYRNYQVILQIYQEYPASQYKLPQEFSEPIPGEALYLKYCKCLTDKKTGIVYMDLS
jgi:hypothetical protein